MSAASDFRRNWRYSRRSHHTREESLDMVNGRVLDLRRGAGYVYAPDPSLLTWSDQSGWGHHCTAPASANQPTVVASGVDFDGAAAPNGDHLINAALGTALGTLSDLYFAVTFKGGPSAVLGGLVHLSPFTSTDGEFEILARNSIIYWRTNAAAQAVQVNTDLTAAWHIADCPIVAGVGTPSLDGIDRGTLACGSLSFVGLKTVIGARLSSATCWDGTISNVLISTDSSPENVALARRVLLRDKP